MRTFVISDEDEAKIEAWMKEVETQRIADNPKDKNINYAGAIGGQTTYCFTQTSIGVGLHVSHFGVKKDFTDFESW